MKIFKLYKGADHRKQRGRTAPSYRHITVKKYEPKPEIDHGSNRCVCCNAEIPEGYQVCWKCISRVGR